MLAVVIVLVASGSSTVPPALVAIGVAIITAGATYLAAAKRLSGKIDTSEAGQLWEESRSIRQDYRDRAASAEKRQADLEARVADLEHRNNELGAENLDLMKRQLELQRTCAELRDERDELKQAIEALRAERKDRRADDD